MERSFVIQNRPIGLAELEQMGALVADHPDWSRYRLSRELILCPRSHTEAGHHSERPFVVRLRATITFAQTFLKPWCREKCHKS
jgi:hypothetical protein